LKEKKLEQLKNEKGMDIDVIQIEDEDEDEEETFINRFIDSLINHLLKGISSNNKVVRYRVCQLIALSLDTVTEMEFVFYYINKLYFVKNFNYF